MPGWTSPEFRVIAAHRLTPKTAIITHYFAVHRRDFAPQEGVTQFMHEHLFAVIEEDLIGLTLQEVMLRATSDPVLYELSLAPNGPAVSMRRQLNTSADAADVA